MVLFILVLLQLATTIGGQQCLLASNGSQPLPHFERPSTNQYRFRETTIQAIITSYRFNCCGVITGWGAFVNGKNLNRIHQSEIAFQVWRQSSTSVDSTSCYNLTGVNYFDIGLEQFETVRDLINVTTSLNETITVQPGDVVGFNYISRRGNGGILFSDNDSYREESVWFETGQRVETIQTICQLEVERFTNLAPLITATVVPTSCAQDTSSPTLKLQASRVSTSYFSASVSTSYFSASVSTSYFSASVSISYFSTPAVPKGLTPAENLGLTTGAAAGASVLLVFTISIFCIILLCAISQKRKSRQPVSKIRFTRSKRDVRSSAITNNKAYGKFAQVNQPLPDNVYDSVYTTQKNASTVQGQVYSDTDYYTNEGLVGGGNKPGSNPDPSLPTTENQAYTSVSADTERVEIEEIYDSCV